MASWSSSRLKLTVNTGFDPLVETLGGATSTGGGSGAMTAAVPFDDRRLKSETSGQLSLSPRSFSATGSSAIEGPSPNATASFTTLSDFAASTSGGAGGAIPSNSSSLAIR